MSNDTCVHGVPNLGLKGCKKCESELEQDEKT